LEEIEMKRLINRLRLLIGSITLLAALQVSAQVDPPEAIIISPVQPEHLVLNFANTVEVLVLGVSELNPVSVARLYANEGYAGLMDELIANNSYTFEYIPINTGEISLHAEVQLADGSIFESAPVEYNVSGSGGSLEVSILAPASGSSYLPGTNLPVQVVATAPGSLVAKVEYFLNEVLVETSSSAPFRTEIQLPSIGDYSLVAKAFNISGDFAESEEVLLSAGAPDAGTPRITMEFPLPLGGGDTVNDVSYASAMFLNARAVDADGTIEYVEFYINGQALGLAEAQVGDVYSYFYDPNALGSYLITAKVEDNDGNISWTIPLPLDVGPLERPLPQAEVAPPLADIELGDEALVFIEADGGLISVDRVDLFVDGIYVGSSDAPIAEKTFAVSWEPEATGNYDLQARIVQIDPAGATYDNWKITDAVEFTVIDRIVDPEIPEPNVSIFAPFEGSIYPAGTLIPVQLEAYDPAGVIDVVEIFLNGTMIVTYSFGVSPDNNTQWSVDVPHPNIVPVADIPWRTNVQLPSGGVYTIQARVTSSTGGVSVSTPVSVEAKSLSGGPIINIVSPVSGSSYLPGTILPVQVQAYDPGGLIEEVEFLLNDVVVETVTTAPFRADVQLPSSGVYVLTARATSNTGAQAFSQEIDLSAGAPDKVSPRVIIDFPLPLGGGDTVNDVSYASSMFLNATVLDPDGGEIGTENVEFYINGEFLGKAENKLGDVFSLFYDPNAQGNYVISVKATDPQGNESWSLPLLLDVGPLERQLPNAKMVQPFPESILGRVVGIFVEADGGLIAVDRVDFFANGIYLGSSDEPVVDNLYSFNWIPQEPGDYDLQARVIQIDPAGATWDNWKIADPVAIKITEPPAGTQPVIEITNPANGSSSVVLRPIMVQVNALDPLGSIEEVRFYVNGKKQEIVDTAFPYGFTYQPQSPGQFQIVAEMITDRGLLVHSNPATIEVGVTQLPSGVFSSPGDVNPTAGSTVPLTVEASDPDGYVEYVEFYVNGRLEGADTSAPFTVFWRPLSSGVYDISALLKDNSGHEVIISRTITVIEPVGIVPRVTLSVTGSGNVTPGSRVVVLANVYDDTPDDLDVTFFMNGVQLGETDTEAPYSVIVDPEVGGISFGAYSLTAIAADPDGNSRADTLNPLYISDFSVDQPSIEIINIEEGDNYTIGSRVPIRVEIKGGAALNLQDIVFYANGEEIGRLPSGEVTGRYSFDWLPDSTGSIQLTAATLLRTEYYDHDRDSGGLAATPSIPVTPVNVAFPVNINVNEAVGTLPSISLGVFPGRDNLAIGSKVMIYADAQDLGGGVSKVEFFFDGQSISVDTEAPFSHVLTTTHPGDFALNALATDTDGNVVTSTVVTLQVLDRVITRTPEITLTVPASGQEGNPLSLRASAQGFVTGPEAVVFYVNGQEVGQSAESPYSHSWLSNLSGVLSFFATAQQPLSDGSLVTTVSDIEESFLVGNLPPVIDSFTVTFPNADELTKPRPVAGDALNFLVNLTDTGAIKTVELLLNGEVVSVTNGGNSPFDFTDVPPGEGIYQYTAVVTDRGGLQTQSETLIVTVDKGSGNVVDPKIPQIESLTSNVVGGSSLVNLPIVFTVDASDEEGIARVDLYQGDMFINSTFTEPYSIEYTPTSAGSYAFRAVAVNLQGNQVSSEILTISVRHPDPLNQNTDFVYQTFIDLLMRTPTIEERSYYTNRIETEGLTRDRFIRELMSPIDGQLDDYNAVRGVFLANKFLLGQWPTREDVEQDVQTVIDGGLLAVVSSLMIEFEPIYVGATGAPGVPDILSSTGQIEQYIKYLWNQKYGKGPNGSQLDLATLYFQSLDRDQFTSDFIEDIEVLAFGSSFISLGLGFEFPASAPPSDAYLREADAASLLSNLLRIVPTNEEVVVLSQKLFATQVFEILNDPRYAARFATPFSSLKHYAEGWKESDWFGWFNTSYEPWVYHAEQGWIAFSMEGQSEENFWYWDAQMGWIWTQAELFPVMYDQNDACWLLTPRLPYSTSEGRWFFNFDQNRWMQP